MVDLFSELDLCCGRYLFDISKQQIMSFNVAGISTDSMVCSIIDLKRAFSFSFFFYHAISAVLNLECKIV